MLLPLVLFVAGSFAGECPGLDAEIEAIDHAERCLTMPLRRAWQQAREQGSEACLTRALEARALPATGMPLSPPVEPALFMPDKSVRDVYHLPNSRESENFIVWWGDEGDVSTGDVDDMIEAFELGWDHLVETMDLPQPDGTLTYKFNVYIGDSGSGAPSSYGAAGYFWYDSQGYPIIVMSLGLMGDLEWCQTTAVHEFFHAVQGATGAYATDTGSWLWEASATWVEGEIYPESYIYAVFLYGFGYLPHLPLDFYDYPDTGALEEYHQYGAFIFPRYLSEIAFDWTIVRDAWDRGGPSDDPIEVFDELMQEQGEDFDTVWASFVAHNASWDYADGDTYESIMDAYDGWYDNYFLTASYSSDGTRDWVTPTQRLPQRYGVNNLQLRYPQDGTLQVELELDATGSRGSEAKWAVTLVRQTYDQRSYELLEPVDGLIQRTVEGVGDESSIWLTVGVSCDYLSDGEEFGYSYRLWVESDDVDTGTPADTGEDDEEEPGGCGCAAGAAGGAGWLVLLGLGVLARRRR